VVGEVGPLPVLEGNTGGQTVIVSSDPPVLTFQQQIRAFPDLLVTRQQVKLAEILVELTSPLPPLVLRVRAFLALCSPLALSLAEAGSGVHRRPDVLDGF